MCLSAWIVSAICLSMLTITTMTVTQFALPESLEESQMTATKTSPEEGVLQAIELAAGSISSIESRVEIRRAVAGQTASQVTNSIRLSDDSSYFLVESDSPHDRVERLYLRDIEYVRDDLRR
jgi:hypothetical protein